MKSSQQLLPPWGLKPKSQPWITTPVRSRVRGMVTMASSGAKHLGESLGIGNPAYEMRCYPSHRAEFQTPFQTGYGAGASSAERPWHQAPFKAGYGAGDRTSHVEGKNIE